MMNNYVPNRKMTAVGIGGAISVILIWILETYVLADPIPGQVAGALALLCGWACGYQTKEK